MDIELIAGSSQLDAQRAKPTRPPQKKRILLIPETLAISLIKSRLCNISPTLSPILSRLCAKSDGEGDTTRDAAPGPNRHRHPRLAPHRIPQPRERAPRPALHPRHAAPHQ